MFFTSFLFYLVGLTIFTIVVLLYKVHCSTRSGQQYFKQIGVKGPSPVLFLGNLVEFSKGYLGTFDKWRQEFGTLYGYHLVGKPRLVVGDPALVREILVEKSDKFLNKINYTDKYFGSAILFANAHDWKPMRVKLSKLFSSRKLRLFFESTSGLIRQEVDKIDSSCNVLETRELAEEITLKFLFKIIYSDTDYQGDKLIAKMRAMFPINPVSGGLEIILSGLLSKDIDLDKVIYHNSSKFNYDQLIKMLNSKKLKPNNKHADMMSMLMDMEAEKNTDENDETNDRLVSQFWFLLSTYRTTSSVIIWTLFELSVNPSIQQRLYEDIASTVDTDGHIDNESLQSQTYFGAVVSECLRLHSPTVIMDRQCNEDCLLGPNNIPVKKGLDIELDLRSIHLSPSYYDEPLKFNPERFMPENKSKILPYTYLPFSLGPRMCLGKRLVFIFVKIVLAQLLGKYRVTPVSLSETAPNSEKFNIFNVMPSNRLKFESRK